jgi:catechol 2,3-dioxygenase-like lactoylglutathione lyase family enzyme
MTTRFDVVGIVVADMARSLAFYRATSRSPASVQIRSMQPSGRIRISPGVVRRRQTTLPFSLDGRSWYMRSVCRFLAGQSLIAARGSASPTSAKA